MLYEYAVEPQTVGSSWQTFRYVIEKFGFDKGRLISQYPKSWFRDVYTATAGFPAVQRKRAEEALNLAKRNKVVRSSRSYDPVLGDWLHNALAQHALSPFRAIVASENPSAQDFVLPVNDLDEMHPLMVAPRDCEVDRDAMSLALAMTLMLRFGVRILFVDPYYDPFSPRYQSTLRECLKVVKSVNPGASCEIHHRDREEQPSVAAIEREARTLFERVIPAGMMVTVYRWREKITARIFMHATF